MSQFHLTRQLSRYLFLTSIMNSNVSNEQTRNEVIDLTMDDCDDNQQQQPRDNVCIDLTVDSDSESENEENDDVDFGIDVDPADVDQVQNKDNAQVEDEDNVCMQPPLDAVIQEIEDDFKRTYGDVKVWTTPVPMPRIMNRSDAPWS